MPFVMNCRKEEVSTRAAGNWFSWKPEEIKYIKSDDIAKFIQEARKEEGLMVLPEELDDPSVRTAPEGKAAILRLKEEGLSAYIDSMRRVVYNNQVSLRRDLAQAGINADPAAFASQGELDAMEAIAKYNLTKQDFSQERIDRVKELMKTVGPSISKREE